ncbi:MAG: nucleotidyl transferase AbiEii/AbiGii toxin family protein [Kangiellaceae bacterium]|nr:nucleotidyl transferase AbiEii/AbiGii toxin family protein [Kangiellaceae bacterium]
MSSSSNIVKNKPASVRDRLKVIAKADNIDFQRLLNNYAIQKFLVRIDKSSYRENLMLKGSWLFVAWSGSLHRPTKDADMLGVGDFNKQQIKSMFEEIMKIEVDDGLHFLPESIDVSDITKDGFYQGFRTIGIFLLDRARIKVQVDIGFGDAVSPSSTIETIPCMLGEGDAVLRAYPIYTAISEKWHAINKLGMKNSRLKDYYDLYVIANLQNLEYKLMFEAVKNTFDRRETKISSVLPIGISPEFFNDDDKIKAWAAFLRKNDLKCESSLSDICKLLERFLFSINLAIAENKTDCVQWISTKLNWS